MESERPKFLWVPPYSIITRKIETGPDTWEVNNVEVLGPDGNPVHAYRYNYSMRPPFYPFELDGQWYALYSSDYTASRIMKLPSGEDVWGEDRDAFGFCPVEFFVPAYQWTEFGGDRTGKLRGTFTDHNFQLPGYNEKYKWTVHPVQYHNFGFVCGCVWGDDSSWKVKFFDFKDIKNGKVVYDDRFGYFELHPKLSLQDSIEIYGNPDTDREKIEIVLTGFRQFSFFGNEKKDDDAVV